MNDIFLWLFLAFFVGLLGWAIYRIPDKYGRYKPPPKAQIPRLDVMTPNEMRRVKLPPQMENPVSLHLIPYQFTWADHPSARHDMKFKKKYFSHAMGGVTYKFRCLYCHLEVDIKFRDYWGVYSPKAAPPDRSWVKQEPLSKDIRDEVKRASD